MTSMRSSTLLLILLALAVGWFAGLSRHDDPSTTATAGAPMLLGENVVTTAAEGGDLIVWTMRFGRPQHAERYSLRGLRDLTGPEPKESHWMERVLYELRDAPGAGK